MLTRKTITLKNKFFVFKKTKNEINNIPYTAIFTSSIPPGQISHIFFSYHNLPRYYTIGNAVNSPQSVDKQNRVAHTMNTSGFGLRGLTHRGGSDFFGQTFKQTSEKIFQSDEHFLEIPHLHHPDLPQHPLLAEETELRSIRERHPLLMTDRDGIPVPLVLRGQRDAEESILTEDPDDEYWSFETPTLPIDLGSHIYPDRTPPDLARRYEQGIPPVSLLHPLLLFIPSIEIFFIFPHIFVYNTYTHIYTS